MKSFCSKKDVRSQDVVKAHTDAVFAFKAFGFYNNINLDTTRMKGGDSEPTNELKTAINALTGTVDTAERTMRSLCVSTHAILLLSIIKLPIENALMARPEKIYFRTDQVNATIIKQSCFGALAY